MGERIKATVPVFVFLLRGEGTTQELYLQRRSNTGFSDGYYETIAGKIDNGESPQQAARREAREEAGIHVAEQNLRFFHAYLDNQNPNHPWLGLMFQAMQWEGEPSIAEPHRCDHAGWFPMSALPEKLMRPVRDALAGLALGATCEISYYSPSDKEWLV